MEEKQARPTLDQKLRHVPYQERHPLRLSRWAIGLVLVWTLFPLWWAFALSVKHPADFFTAKALPFLQFRPTLEHWQAEWQAFGDPAGLGHGLANSLIVASLSSGVSLVLGSLAAFGLLLRYRAHRPNRSWIFLLLMPRIIPPVIVALPFSLLMDRLGLDDTLLALTIAHTTVELPLAILILFAAMTNVPGDLLDAARIDGCTAAAVLWRIVMPSLGPVLAAVSALCFTQSWNEFLYALMNVQQQAQTAPLAIAALLNKDGIEFDYVGSHLLLVTLPPLLLAFLAQRFLAFGLSLGALKAEE